jgi:hypothetical protein
MKMVCLLGFALLCGCVGEESDGPCADLCGVLVGECGYAAFPDMASCLDGCAFEASEGQDVVGEAICVSNAECDTFAILECENTFGK